MGTVKATTIQQRFGFSDGDLKTPMHDEIMLWLDSKVGEIYIPKLIGWNNNTLLEIEKFSLEYSQKHPEWEGFVIPDLVQPEITEKTWEFAISSGNYVIGFLDLFVKVEIPGLNLFTGIGSYQPKVHIDKRNTTHEILFEVKTSIPSLGELIRQIRFYQEYLPDGKDMRAAVGFADRKYIVVCPDDRFKEPLAQQGIGFLKYEL
jgi:hypothetical protein